MSNLRVFFGVFVSVHKTVKNLRICIFAPRKFPISLDRQCSLADLAFFVLPTSINRFFL
jgi:hypothetical protein